MSGSGYLAIDGQLPIVTMTASNLTSPLTSQTYPTVDLTDPESDPMRQVIDLSSPTPSPAPSPQRAMPSTDHMHSVIDIIHKHSSDFPAEESPKDAKAEAVSVRRKHATSGSLKRTSFVNSSRNKHESTRKRHKPLSTNSRFIVPSGFDDCTISDSSNPSLSTSPSHADVRSSGKNEDESDPFRFLSLPPEIRNSVYRLLLTTPSSPIELPRLANKIATRSAEWRKCKSARRKARFKSIFLEILQTCKQVHNEASGILYGCNVFKFRSCYSEGAKKIVLPTRHLHLLKHIKVAVISLAESLGQDRWVADLLKSFMHEDMQLETFELAWYGWRRLCLRKGGPLSLALQMLHVDRQFVVKIAGEARMQKDMALELQQNVRGARVEIHRPVKISTDGNSVELSDDEER